MEKNQEINQNSQEKLVENVMALEHEVTELKGIINKSPAISFIWINQEGWPVEYVSENVKDLFGYTAEEFNTGEILYARTIHPDDLKRVEREVNVYSNEKDREEFTHEPYRIITKEGKVKWLDDHTYIRRNEKGEVTHFQGVVLDITERLHLQLRLQQAQKMESITILAGGIAHQFNNILSAIMGNLELLEMDTNYDDITTQYTKPMKNAIQKMEHLTSQLLAYARGGKYQDKTVSVNDILRDALPLAEHIFKGTASIETEVSNDVFDVVADLTQMQMAISAILNNAKEAIEGKGHIRIVCRNKQVSYAMARDFPGLIPGQYVSLRIEDNGRGMDEETKNHIFEPFFTTKFQGRGLGMAAVYGIVKNHNGWISVESEPGKGTAVDIYLPASKEKVKKMEKPKITPVRSGGTVLLIEDEDIVMEVNSALLKKLGCRVLEAKTGKEAIEIAGTYDGDIECAILDILLPDLEGKDVYHLLMEKRPLLKVIVCSGYSIDGPAQQILNAGAHGFLPKPFTIASLSNKLNENLGS